jgi:DNA-binding NarL/FixJ family response regulator
MTLSILVTEDNDALRPALCAGLEATGQVRVALACARGEDALSFALRQDTPPAAALLDVQLAGALSGIDTAVALRREIPRFPVVFYSIQDDDRYFRDFRRAGILSHYAFVRKSNFLLPNMVVPLLRDALAGRAFIDPDIDNRVEQVRRKDENDPLALLEPNEREVARMLADGMTNEQIAAHMGYRDKRTISRVNGQIYATWGLADSSTDEKVARTRAALIFQRRQLLRWDEQGAPRPVELR